MSSPFVKTNRTRYRDQLICEAHGLEALRHALSVTTDPAAYAGLIEVPQVIRVDEHTLTLPLIASVRCTARHWSKLGRGLAGIHAQPQGRFGFDQDNYIGGNPQPNAFSDSWGDFFLTQRLEFQVGLIAERTLKRQFSERLRRCARRLREFLDTDVPAPSLVHGDLWNGNVMCGENERVWLIDPAVYYGDSEVDLAMSEMFGGFPAEFYAAYRACRPEPPNWPLKKQIYNLYHYLNHLNLFGSGYLNACQGGFAALDKI